MIAHLHPASRTSSAALAALRLTLLRPRFSLAPSSPYISSITAARYASRSSLSPSAASETTSSHSSKDHSDPLAPNIPLTSLGLPVHPLPLPSPSASPAAPLTREALHRLHRLSALNPPPDGSAEEQDLIEGLRGLIGLMDAVKAVELPNDEGGYGALLGRGVGELELDFSKDAETRKEERGDEGVKRDKELLEYATRRVGDYYASRLPQKSE